MIFKLYPLIISTGFCAIPDNAALRTSRDCMRRLTVTGTFDGVRENFDFYVDSESDNIGFRAPYLGLAENNLILLGRTYVDPRIQIPRIPEIPRFYEMGPTLAIGYNSEFAQTVGSLMLVPRQPDEYDTSFQMILSPTDPESFCMDRQLVVTSVDTSLPGRYEFEVEVSLIANDSGETIPLTTTAGGDGFADQQTEAPHSITGMYRISTFRPKMQLPAIIRQVIADAIRAEGLRYDPRLPGLNSLLEGCADRISRLPTISFGIKRDRQTVGNIVLAPEDYIHVDRITGNCKVNMDVETIHDDHPSVYNYLGYSFLERVGTFFDYQNREIGFCEPN